MPLFEILFKVSHDCPLGNISRKFPAAKMIMWCNREHEIIEITMKDRKDCTAIVEELSRAVDVVEKSFDKSKLHLITGKCRCTLENSVIKKIDAANLLHLPPVIYDKGWEHYHVIAFQHKDVETLLDTIEKKNFHYQILSKLPFKGSIASSLALTTDLLFSQLTAKQTEALLTSYYRGYYKIPRTTSLASIAKNRHVPRTTFEEHLRKAENKLMRRLIPYLELSRKALQEKGKH